MVRFTGGLLLFTAWAAAAPAETPSQHDQTQKVIAKPSKPQPSLRPLQGKFLHITDIHPDPFYLEHSDPGEVCHRGKGDAGYYGAEVTSCDTPFTLVNATFRWIKEHLKDQVDFVIWTGDSARHDNDDNIPRNDKSVIQLNQFIVDKFVEVFGKTDNVDDPDPTNDFVVPIIPTFGNNDILPHNIFLPGPNKWTRSYSEIWEKFVPQAQRHSFARGGWFFTEVIPNKLAVFSLNTLYFFDSNSAVDGCDSKSDPGYEHMEWLRIQLQFLRQRGMKAILIGHVPPARTESKQSWDESCYQKYTLWLRQYRDVIISSMFGHMNVDHFMFQDAKDLIYKFKIEGVDDEFERPNDALSDSNNDTFTISAKSQYLKELRNKWSNLPTPPPGHSYLTPEGVDSSELVEIEKKKKKKGKKKKGGKKKQTEQFLKDIGGPWGERFSVSLDSPSVVPNFFPTLRIFEYNITGMEYDHPAFSPTGIPAEASEVELEPYPDGEDALFDATDRDDDRDFDPDHFEDDSDDLHDLKKKRKKGKKKKKKNRKKKPKFPVPKPPSATSPPGPGYSPQPLSLVSYTQYYANLTEIHERMHQDKTLKRDPYKYFHYEFLYNTKNDSHYHMPDLTVRSYLDLAERIGRDTLPHPDQVQSESDIAEQSDIKASRSGNGKKRKKQKKIKNHLWKVFVKRAFVYTKPDEEIDQDFGD
ncbi:Endopolyphosphatase, partial [Aureobasidium melanogenum]